MPAAAIEEVDFSELTRARDATPPDAVTEVERLFSTIAARIGSLG